MSYYRNLITRFSATGTAQVLAAITGLGSGFGRLSRQQDQLGNRSGYLNNQMKALGTTIRYALAGTAVFAIPQAISQLSQFEVQLGAIAAIGSQGGLPLVGSQLQDLTSQVERASVQAITPVKDFNDALINLYSTIENVSPSKAVQIVSEFSKLGQLTQTTPIEAQQSALGLQYAFNRPHTLEEAKRQSREIFTLIQSAPGGVAAGPQIYQQLGPLSSSASFAGLTQEQMLGLALASLRGGGTPATSLRGLTFLLQDIRNPQTKEAKAAWAGLGVTPAYFAQPGHNALTALIKAIQAVRARGGIQGNLGRLNALPEDILGSDVTQVPVSDLGMRGPGADLAGALIHRIYGLRTFARLQSQASPITGKASLTQDINEITRAGGGYMDDVHNVKKAWDRYEQQARLKEAAVAINALSLQTVSIFKPVLDWAGKRVTGLQSAVVKNPGIYQDVVLGILGGAGAFGLAKKFGMFGGGGLGLSRFLRPGLIGKGIADEVAGIRPDGTPEHPFFVVPIGAGLGGGGGVVGGGGRGGAGASAVRKGLLGFGLGATALAAGDVTALLTTPGSQMRTAKDFPLSDPRAKQKYPLFSRLAEMGIAQNQDWIRGHPRMWTAIQAEQAKKITLPELEKRLENIQRENRVHVSGEVTVHVQADKGTTVDGQKTKDVHVPFKSGNFFPLFTSNPQTRGKDRTSRR